MSTFSSLSLRTTLKTSGVPRNFGGESTNSVEDKGHRERRSKSLILITLLRMYFRRNWEFGSALSKLRNFWVGGLNTPTPPPGYATAAQLLLRSLRVSHRDTGNMATVVVIKESQQDSNLLK
jgi:hypothetical protein